MNEIKIFSPATVANVACGFDVLGFCLDNKGDEMVIRKTTEKLRPSTRSGRSKDQKDQKNHETQGISVKATSAQAENWYFSSSAVSLQSF